MRSTPVAHQAQHVWEKVEIILQVKREYENPYADVLVWVDLRGPGSERRCFGFWDGGTTFRVRVLAPSPGTWHWRSGSLPVDSGLAGQEGTFEARPWTEDEKAQNACRRGMIQASANGHAFDYADGTPFFLLGDTWWATPTSRFPWFDDDRPRPLGPQAGFKDYVAFRKRQEYNCIALLAAFPNWHNDGHPARLETADGMILRSAWGQAGTGSAKSMTDEEGRRPFLFPGRVPGYEDVIPDLERINPGYFQSMDRKIDYLNGQGMVPFIEVARRDIGQAWLNHYPWPDSYTRYIQYVWSRYQANVCLFSPIHFDSPEQSIPVTEWNRAANLVVERYGPPPFGTPCGTNANPSSLENWGHTDQARWLDFHQIGNRRTHDCYAYLTGVFAAKPPVPGINGEPYYDGMEGADPGSDMAALYCRSAMYGSILSGGLGGHIYGAGGWGGGIWSGEVEPESKFPIWDALLWQSADQLRHLKTFVFSEIERYQDLIPNPDLLAPNRSGKPGGLTGWAYCAGTADQGLFLLYFEEQCPAAILSGALSGRCYHAQWFDPRQGQWLDSPMPVTADHEGRIFLPPFPGDSALSTNDWALKLTLRAEEPRG